MSVSLRIVEKLIGQTWESVAALISWPRHEWDNGIKLDFCTLPSRIVGDAKLQGDSGRFIRALLLTLSLGCWRDDLQIGNLGLRGKSSNLVSWIPVPAKYDSFFLHSKIFKGPSTSDRFAVDFPIFFDLHSEMDFLFSSGAEDRAKNRKRGPSGPRQGLRSRTNKSG